MKRIYYFPLYIFLLISCKNVTTSTEKNDSIVHSEQNDSIWMAKAREDVSQNQLKYYFHSISLPRPQIIKLLNDSCKIQIAGIDVVSRGEVAYNQVTDSVIYAKFKKHFSELLAEK